MQIDRIDHLVLTVQDIDKTCDFYVRVLGMDIITFGDGRITLQFGGQKINLHRAGHEFEPKATHPTSGSGDLCVITTTGLSEVLEHLHACNVGIVEGPVTRIGAQGRIESVYVRDPDGNLVEIARYP